MVRSRRPLRAARVGSRRTSLRRSPRSRPWRALLRVVVGLLPLFAAAAPAPHPSSGTDVEGLREFLIDPPRFRNLLVRRVLSVAPVSFRSRRDAARFAEQLDRSRIAAPGQTSLFQIRFQADPPAFFLRTLSTEADADDVSAPRLPPFAGRYETNWWSIPAVTPGQVILLHSHDGTDVGGPGGTNAFYRGHERWATEFLRLGMLELLPETIVWSPDGSTFVAQEEDGGEWTGTCAQGATLGECEILLRPRSGGPEKAIHVSADRKAGRWLPRRVRIDRSGGAPHETSPQPYADYECLAAEVSDSPLGREWFSPEKYLHPKDLWVELDHGEFYVLEARGTDVIRTLAPVARSTWSLYLLTKVALVVGLVLAGLRLIWGYVREWRRRGANDLSGSGPNKNNKHQGGKYEERET